MIHALVAGGAKQDLPSRPAWSMALFVTAGLRWCAFLVAAVCASALRTQRRSYWIGYGGVAVLCGLAMLPRGWQFGVWALVLTAIASVSWAFASTGYLKVGGRVLRWIVVLAFALTACSPAPKTVSPPSSFPDLSAFPAVDAGDYDDLGDTNFLSPNEEIDCTLDRGPWKSMVCHDFPGVPGSVGGKGCPTVRKADDSGSDVPYVISRSANRCVTAKSVRPMLAGRKLVGKNATCVVGKKDQLVACIDADNRHGFVLQPSGSWAF